MTGTELSENAGTRWSSGNKRGGSMSGGSAPTPAATLDATLYTRMSSIASRHETRHPSAAPKDETLVTPTGDVP